MQTDDFFNGNDIYPLLGIFKKRNHRKCRNIYIYNDCSIYSTTHSANPKNAPLF